MASLTRRNLTSENITNESEICRSIFCRIVVNFMKFNKPIASARLDCSLRPPIHPTTRNNHRLEAQFPIDHLVKYYPITSFWPYPHCPGQLQLGWTEISFIINLRPPTQPPGIVVLHSLEAQFTIDHLVKALVLPHDIFLTLSTTVQAEISFISTESSHPYPRPYPWQFNLSHANSTDSYYGYQDHW